MDGPDGVPESIAVVGDIRRDCAIKGGGSSEGERRIGVVTFVIMWEGFIVGNAIMFGGEIEM